MGECMRKTIFRETEGGIVSDKEREIIHRRAWGGYGQLGAGIICIAS